MLLVIDVGNTNTAIGLYNDDQLVSDWRLATDRYRTADEWGQLMRSLLHLDNRKREAVHAIAISSVVPPLDGNLERMSHRYFSIQPFFVSMDCDLGMEVHYHPPSDVGADRLVNAVAARHYHGSPAIVIDFGTATTFDLINAQGAYVGGVICPGIGISSNALFERAAKLPRVDLKKPGHVVGANTVDSIRGGLYYGYLAQIRGIIDRIRDEQSLPDLKVITTGGLARVFENDLGESVIRDANLTLEGLRLIYNRNNT